MSTVEIKIQKANFTKEDDYAKKLDPFFKFEFRNEIFQTQIKKNAGQNAQWENEVFKFQNVRENEVIVFKAYDSNIGTDILIGETRALKLIKQGLQTHQLFTTEQEDAGSAQITITSKPVNEGDWRSTVKIVPPNILKFQVSKEDVLDPKKPKDEIKGTASMEIFNNGTLPILFKIKTTKKFRRISEKLRIFLLIK